MHRDIYVTLDHGLSTVLARVLRQELGHAVCVFEGPTTAALEGDVAIVSAASCSPARVARFRAQGLLPVVLAALPSAANASAYERSGACGYLPMDPNVTGLVEALRPLIWPGRAVFAGS